MAAWLNRYGGPLAAALLVLLVGGAMLLGWQRWQRDYEVTVEEDGSAVTKVIADRLDGMSDLKVSQLSGTIQATAQDIRGMGLLRSDQVVKMPFAVDYFVDVGRIGAADLQWDEAGRTLIVNAPDVRPAAPNIDESRRTLVRTGGLIVTRKAAEELNRKASIHARDRAVATARSPERMAQARENGRRALVKLMAAPLAAAGHGDARVIVTFPPERGDPNRDRWDVTTPINQVLANSKQGR